MKRILTTILISLFLLGTVSAQDFVDKGINYVVTDFAGKKVAVQAQGVKYKGDVIIPETATYNDRIYTVTGIKEYSFQKCSELKSIKLPATLTEIGRYAFLDCNMLTGTFNIPVSVAVLGQGVFAGCKSLKEFKVDAENKSFSSENGVLFNKDKTELLTYPNGNTSTNYNIPNGVQTIGKQAFQYCTYLENIEIPNTVISIGANAFNNCNNLKSLILPEGITSIESYCFAGAKSLTKLIIPSSVKRIDDDAFSGCVALVDLYTYPNPPVNLEGVWAEFPQSIFATCRLHIPHGSKEAYQNAETWKNFTNLIEMTPSSTSQLQEIGVQIRTKSNMLVLTISQVSELYIFTILGKTILKKHSFIGTERISLPKGIYLVKVNGLSKKVVIR